MVVPRRGGQGAGLLAVEAAQWRRQYSSEVWGHQQQKQPSSMNRALLGHGAASRRQAALMARVLPELSLGNPAETARISLAWLESQQGCAAAQPCSPYTEPLLLLATGTLCLSLAS